VDPHIEKLIDLQYFMEKLKANGHKVLILIDANQAEEQTYQPQPHNIKLVTTKGFHVDGSLDGSLQRFMQNCSLINVLRQMHEGVVPNTHARESVQIDFTLTTSSLAEHVLDVGPINRFILQSDQSVMFFDLQIEGIFGQYPDKLAPRKFRDIKLDDPRTPEKYQKILHKQF
jgi:hypothetical protein